MRGFFDTRRLRQFRDQCSPSLEEVFHRAPFHNERVAHFAAAYPKTLCKFVAQQNVALFSLQGSETAEEVERPYSTPPRWISELGRSLHWRKVLQYAFRKLNHINIDESLSYRSLLKHLAKTSPKTRFCTLLDSRVVIGSSAKGRSSSKQLNFYMSTTVPYIIGGDLYPYLLHIGTSDNPSDDVSRFVQLREPEYEPPHWLQLLILGDHAAFDIIQACDSLRWPFNGWARLTRLLLMKHFLERAQGGPYGFLSCNL